MLRINKNSSRTPSTDCVGTRRGTAAIEAALMMPVLIFVFLGAIDIAQYINVSQVVTNASREGARIAIRNSTNSSDDVEDVVYEYLQETFPQLTGSSLTDTVKVNVEKVAESDTENEDIDGNDGLSDIESGDTISVAVSFDFSAVRWLPGPDYWGGNAYQSTTICRRQ